MATTRIIRAIFWATLAIVNAVNGALATGASRYVIAVALAVSLIGLWTQTFKPRKTKEVSAE